jgi:hypothetical protein
MSASDLLTRIASVRRDLGSMLFHFTRAAPAEGGNRTRTAYENLESILKERRLRGAAGAIKGGHKCVCFTEAPITEMAALFNLSRISAGDQMKPRYEPFGIAVPKKWLFERGGRPVIYQPVNEYAALPAEMQYRHVSYDPVSGIDFTWEREWRIRTDSLVLEPRHTLVVVPDASEAFYLGYLHSELEVDVDRDGTPEGASHQPTWVCVSLDFFGLV